MAKNWQWLWRRKQAEADLDDELRDHLERETEHNIRAGMDPEEARFAAQRLTGSVALLKEECRDQRSLGFLETFGRDLRYSFRMLQRTPLFAAVGLITLAIGIGANTVVFTFVENILLRSLPVPDAERVTAINWGGGPSVSFPNYLDFRDRNSTFSDLAAFSFTPANMTTQSSGNFRMWGYVVTGNYFPMLGVKSAMGRLFGPEEDQRADAHPVMVISYRCWQTRFGSDPRIIGQAIKVNGFPFSIIGVAAPAFTGTELIVDADYWLPFSMLCEADPGSDWTQYRTSQNAWIIGRLKPGVPPAQAEANLTSIAGQLARQYPNEVSGNDKMHLSKPGLLGDALRGPITGFGLVLMSIAALGLLLACVNLAGMLLARASDRRREIGIRLAIGASRGQLLRQLLTESLLLAVGGGVFGYASAVLACRFLTSWHVDFGIPINVTIQPNALVLAFTVALAFITTLICGLAPALQTVKVDLLPSLRNEPLVARFRKWSVRDVLVTGQIALSVMLVICSVLVVRSLQQTLTIQLGFNPENSASISFDLGLKGYDQARIRRLQADLLRRANEIPGIQSAAIINTLPLNMVGGDSEFMWVAAQPMPKPSERKLTMVYNASPGYLQTAGTRLLAGRDFNEHDRLEAPPVAIINQAFGGLLFGRENPVGKRIRISSIEAPLEVVGVTEDGKYRSLSESGQAAIFVPIQQTPSRWTTLVVRTPLSPEAATEQLRRLVMGMDSDIVIFNVGSLKEHLALPLFAARMAAIVLGSLGVFAMALAAIGLFALMSYAVSRRTREIGIRMALGARRSQVLSSLLKRTLVLCAIGISIGVSATFATGRLLSAILYGVSPRDPLTYCLVLCLMTGVVLFACWMPAARAMRIDPMRALRDE